jgi:multidrug efflux pump
MISRFFIDRPIFAAVLSIVITLAGAISLWTLPLAQFPSISPPTVQVTCNYPGANAQEVANAVAAPIEQQVNGVESMMYMSSQCANDGSYSLTVTFHQGINLEMAQVLVQNRVNLAVPQLPEVIRQVGVTTRKRSPDILMGIAINSPDGRYDQLYLSNLALMQIKDELARVEGVGDVFLFGQRDYSMRIWLDPSKLSARRMSASDVVAAIREQNTQVAAGAIGQEPMSTRQEYQITLSTLGRLSDVEQFENIIVKTGKEGRIVRLKDVARVELGARSSDIRTRLDGNDTVFLAIFQMPDANALDLHDRILKKMDELKQFLPDGVAYDIGFDTTPYTRESIHEVVKTLRDAVILVAIVVLLFLQNWRSALIPLVAVPVAIIGTFSVMAALGFSLNNLTLFGLVLAIGIVVDDAIVVVEAVEHHIEHGLAPRAATLKAMESVSGPVIAVGLVLSAVFVPCAFISGITGQFFRQFALTISVSTIISAFNSLTLSPALTALLLRPLKGNDLTPSPPGTPGGEGWGEGGQNPSRNLEFSTGSTASPPTPLLRSTGGEGGHRRIEKPPPLPRFAFVLVFAWLSWEYVDPLAQHFVQPWLTHALDGWISASILTHLSLGLLIGCIVMGASLGWLVSRPVNWLLGAFFRLFNRAFAKLTAGYVGLVGGLLRTAVIVLLVYGGLLGLTYFRFVSTPRGFIPSQDMGYLMVNVQLPDSASMERTDEVMRKIEKIGLSHPGVRHVTGISGQSFVLNAAGSNFGSLFLNLKEYSQRRDPSNSSDAIAAWLREQFGKEIPDAMVAVFGPPPVRGVGRAGGFAIMIEDRGDFGPQTLQKQVDNLIRQGNVPDKEQLPWLVGADGKSRFVGLFSVFRANVPQLHVHPDPRAAMMRGVNLRTFADTLQTYTGSLYVNDFNLFGRTWQVIAQAEPQFRDQADDLPQLTMRNSRGRMVPLGSVAGLQPVSGPLVLTRYNMYPAAAINGASAPGVSSGEAIALLNRLADRELPQAMSYEWTDMSYLELLAGNTAMLIFLFAVVMVFLVLAAQYESWSLPLAVILVVPMCLLSAVTGVNIANMDINIFTQIGFVVLVGLASKNAILIVEFAKQQRHEGRSRHEATLEACKLRLRPIVMTSLAFVLGVVPLIVSTGAGAEMRRTLGTAVFSGMIGVTLFGLVLTPVFFFAIDWLGHTRLFRSELMQRAAAAAMLVPTLGIRMATRAWAARNGKKASAIAGRPHKLSPNGAANGAAQETTLESSIEAKSPS